MTKLIQLTIAVMLGTLMMSGTASAVQCERIWAVQDLPAGVDLEAEKAALLQQLVVKIDDQERIPSYRFAHKLLKSVKDRCPERFSFLPSNKSAFGYLGFNLRNNGILPNGVPVPEYLDYDEIVNRIGGKGFGLFLPTEKAEVTPTEASIGEILPLSEVNAELNALRSEFNILSKQLNSSSGMEMFIETSINDDMINDIVDRLTELGKLTPQGSVPGGVVSIFEELARTLNEGFQAYRDGGLTPAKMSEIEDRVNTHQSEIEDLKQTVERHDEQLQGLENDGKKQARTISKWQKETSSNYGRIGKLEDNAYISRIIDYIFGVGILLIVFLLFLQESRTGELRAYVTRFHDDVMRILQDADVERLSLRVKTVEEYLNGDGTKEKSGLFKTVAGQERRLKATITVANRADKGVKALEESKDV